MYPIRNYTINWNARIVTHMRHLNFILPVFTFIGNIWFWNNDQSNIYSHSYHIYCFVTNVVKIDKYELKNYNNDVIPDFRCMMLGSKWPFLIHNVTCSVKLDDSIIMRRCSRNTEVRIFSSPSMLHSFELAEIEFPVRIVDHYSSWRVNFYSLNPHHH